MNKWISIFSTLFILFFSACAHSADRDRFDYLITNATIIDGTGSEATTGHVLINDGIIVRIGTFEPSSVVADEIIDAKERVVSPGFIDPHSHGDPIETPRFDNFLSMGVTTITLGQDGQSPGGTDVEGWMNDVDRLGTGPNIIHFVGHNTLRQIVDAPRVPELSPSYINQMKNILSESLTAGSFGLSTGLEYDHGTFADLSELVELAKPVAAIDGLVMSHIRNEDDDAIEGSITELLNQGRGSGAAVHVSHIKIVFSNNPDRAEVLLDLLDEARDEGIAATADVYPYIASFTGIALVFPEWALPPNNYDDIVENRREDLENYLRNRIQMRNGPEATLFGTAPWAGKTLAEVAEELNKPFEDVLIDDIGPRGASAAYFVMNENVMKRFLADPFVMVSSDGSPSMRHPRGYGSFAKIIRQYVTEENLLTLEEAIHKMSGLTAETLGLSNPDQVTLPRGLIKEGFAADLLIFDPQNVVDQATFEEPHRYAEGFDWVFVNGVDVVRNGVKNSTLPGRVIRKN
tara:strand:- start:8086 stop:9639 length:1554 start_codon:yes stop_codon:yes gene_type:complete